MAADACFVPVSSYSYSSKTVTVTDKARTMDWSPDGQFLWIGVISDRTAYSYTGATNWDVTGRTTPTNYRYGFIPEVDSGGDVFSMLINTAPDGTPGGQMLLNLNFGTTFCEIAQYTMPFPYNLRQGDPPADPLSSPKYPLYTPVYIGSYNTITDTGADGIHDMRMSPDGTRLIGATSIAAGDVDLVQWNLTVPYDVLGGMTFQTPVRIANHGFSAMYIPPGGACIYLTRLGTIDQFEFGTPWEISTINKTAVDSLSVSSQIGGTIASVFVTEDNLYAMKINSGEIFQYS